MFFLYLPGCVTTQEEASLIEIDFSFMKGDTAILVPAVVSGEDVTVIFDTGASFDVFGPVFAKKVGLGKTKSHTGRRLTGEPMQVNVGKIGSMSFGDIELRDWDIATHSYFDDLKKEHNIHGLLSLRMFRNRPVTVDYPRKKIILETEESLAKRKAIGNSIPVYKEEMIPRSITVQLDFLVSGQWTQKAMIDTGSAPTKLPYPFFDRLGLSRNSEGYKERKKTTVAGFVTKSVSASSPDRIAIKAASGLTNGVQPIVFYKNLRMGSIGGHFFLDKVVTFDLERDRIIVAKP